MDKAFGMKEKYLSFIKYQKLQTGKQVMVALVVNIIVIAVYVM